MKFWDTIAKMCGVKVSIHQPIRSGEVRGPFMCLITEPWTMRISAFGRTAALTAESKYGQAEAALNGHGVRFLDPEMYPTSNERRGIRIGLIDIERIRPQTAGEVGLSQAAEMIHRAAKAMNPDGVWKHASAADKPS